ncbi:zinc finger protein 706-like [Lineus longissimus]|uniref:zinc finger protein 706-like n=1 Tax=Lineus longissimus TaxID=88925 RepID=UPI002B4E9DB9
MARGHQKVQSQQKNLEKQQKLKKAQGHDQKKAAAAALVHQCTVCKSMMGDLKTYRQHFENKHPGKALPDVLAAEQA